MQVCLGPTERRPRALTRLDSDCVRGCGPRTRRSQRWSACERRSESITRLCFWPGPPTGCTASFPPVSRPASELQRQAPLQLAREDKQTRARLASLPPRGPRVPLAPSPRPASSPFCSPSSTKQRMLSSAFSTATAAAAAAVALVSFGPASVAAQTEVSSSQCEHSAARESPDTTRLTRSALPCSLA